MTLKAEVAVVEGAEACIKAAVQLLREKNVGELHIMAALCITLVDEAVTRKWTKEALKTFVSSIFDQVVEVNAQLDKGIN